MPRIMKRKKKPSPDTTDTDQGELNDRLRRLESLWQFIVEPPEEWIKEGSESSVDKIDLMLLLDLARLGFELVDHALEDVHQREREVDVRRRNQLFAVLSNEPHARLDEPGE